MLQKTSAEAKGQEALDDDEFLLDYESEDERAQLANAQPLLSGGVSAKTMELMIKCVCLLYQSEGNKD